MINIIGTITIHFAVVIFSFLIAISIHLPRIIFSFGFFTAFTINTSIVTPTIKNTPAIISPKILPYQIPKAHYPFPDQ